MNNLKSRFAKMEIHILLSRIPSGNLPVCEIQSILSISGSTLSNHLKTLKYADLTEQRRDGKWIEYFVKDDSVTKLLDQIIEHLEDPEQIESDKEHVRTSDPNICSMKK